MMMEDPFPSTNTTAAPAAGAQNSDDAAADAAAAVTAAAVPASGGGDVTDVSVAILHNDVNIKSVAAADDSEEEDVKKVLSGAASVSTVPPGTRLISVENVRLPMPVTSLPFAPPTTTSSGSTIVAKDPAAAAIVGNILLEAAMEVDHASTESNNNDVKRDLVEEGEEVDDASDANAMQIWTGEGTSKNNDSIRDVAPVQLGALVNHQGPREGFTYTLEAPTSGMVRKGEDSLTYLNKDQFYTLYLEYVPTKLQELKNEVVTSIVTLQFREKKEREEAMSAFDFWYLRPQQTTKVRLLEVDTKSSAGLVGDVNEVAHNAVLVRWSPLISAVNLQIAIRCLSTDFTSQKGVKGIPLHIQVRALEGNADQVGFLHLIWSLANLSHSFVGFGKIDIILRLSYYRLTLTTTSRAPIW